MGHLLAGTERRKHQQYISELHVVKRYWNVILSYENVSVFLPRQCGMSALHTLKEVHPVIAVPFRRKPSSHADTHLEPKLKEPFGSEQDKEP